MGGGWTQDFVCLHSWSRILSKVLHQSARGGLDVRCGAERRRARERWGRAGSEVKQKGSSCGSGETRMVFVIRLRDDDAMMCETEKGSGSLMLGRATHARGTDAVWYKFHCRMSNFTLP